MYFLATPGIGNLVQAHDDLKDYTQEAGLASKDRHIFQHPHSGDNLGEARYAT